MQRIRSGVFSDRRWSGASCHNPGMLNIFGTALVSMFLLTGGTRPQDPAIDLKLLKGAWMTYGPSFDWVIGDSTILFESDMREHPYRLEGLVIVIDYSDPAMAQRKRIVRLTESELEIKDERFGGTTVFRRMSSR